MNAIRIKVGLCSREIRGEPLKDGSLLAKLKTQAMEGMASAEFTAAIARRIEVALTAANIKAGALVRIEPYSTAHS